MALLNWNSQAAVAGRGLLRARYQQKMKVGGRHARVLMSDSNGEHMNGGWERGGAQAMASRFEQFSTGLMSPLHMKTKYQDSGGFYRHARFPSGSSLAPAVRLSDGTVPNAFKILNNIPIAWVPHGDAALYKAAATTDFFNTNQGHILLRKDGPIGVNGLGEYGVMHATSNAGAGAVTLEVWDFDEPTAAYGGQLATGAITCSDAGNPDGTLKFSSLSVPRSDHTSANGQDSIVCGWNQGVGCKGPFCPIYQWYIQKSRARGFSYQAFACQGGKSFYDMADLLWNVINTATMDAYIKALRNQFSVANGGDGTVSVEIELAGGVNDFQTANNHAAVLGVGTYTANLSNTVQGALDNVDAICNYWTARWTAVAGAAAAASELIFKVRGSFSCSDTPVVNPVDYGTNDKSEGWLRQFRPATLGWASGKPNAAAVDIARLITFTEANNADLMYVKDTDVLHGCPGLYALASGLELDAIMAPTQWVRGGR